MTASLETILTDFGIDGARAAKCAAHFDAMVRWNRVHNLTRITTPEKAAEGHYFDCLRAVEMVEKAVGTIPEGWADIGSGAGFPGVLAALTWEAPGRFVEPAKKRASFLSDVCRRLSLSISVEPLRVQEMAPSPLVLSRATFPWKDAAPAFAKVSPGGHLAMLVSTDSPLDRFEEIAQDWGGVDPQRLSYRLPSGIERGVLFVQRPLA